MAQGGAPLTAAPPEGVRAHPRDREAQQEGQAWSPCGPRGRHMGPPPCSAPQKELRWRLARGLRAVARPQAFHVPLGSLW